MEKGFARRLGGLLARGLLVLLLPAALPFSRPSPGPTWWDIRLTVTAKGDYIIRGGEEPLRGEFTCRARWEGTIEKDANDFLLYHLKTEVLEWDLAEKASLPKGESLRVALEDSEKPLLRLNYVLREGSDLSLDFEFSDIPVPLHASSITVGLKLPRSSGRGLVPFGADYGDGVGRGSNLIVLPESDLDRSTAERKFSWEWRRERQVSGDSRTYIVTQRHAAEAVVTLRAH